MRFTVKRLGRVLCELASRRRSKRPTKGAASRFPVFEVQAGTRMIPASRIQRALDEDGIV
jgi:hypothetical protein